MGARLKVALLIDGGYLRACSKSAQKNYDNAFIEAFSRNCILPDEYLLRVFYYDAPQFRGTVQLPVSGGNTNFQANDAWLRELARLERFAVRRGTLGFRGWRPKNIPLAGGRALTDQDFAPIFEQKGVDMRIGLDIATFSQHRSVDRIILVSGDQDMIPAMKQARKAGLEVAVVQLPAPTKALHNDMLCHADLVRQAGWP
jgi:uncharacterized LabA/DUF88 family protein